MGKLAQSVTWQSASRRSQLRETVLAQMRAADMGPKHGTKVTRLLTEGAFAYAR